MSEALFDSDYSEAAAQRADQLYQYLSRKYGLEAATVDIGGRTWRLFRVGDIDAVLDAALDGADPDGQTPYWAELWPSALAMGEWLATLDDLEGADVLELGCGLGLPGMIARKQGARVRLTDHVPDALRFAELHVLSNLGTDAGFALLDWTHPPFDQPPADILIASDLIYEEQLCEPLLAAMENLLAPGGTLFLSEPGRPVAGLFFTMLPERGWTVETVHRRPVPSGRAMATVYAIRRDEAACGGV